MSLANLTKDWAATSYGFLDASAKRELRRKMLKAIAVPGCQMPYASREVPMARGWGTGGLQVTLTLVNPKSIVKVIDQGADDGVNAASIRRFISRVSGASETWDPLGASIVQSRHRIPEEVMREDQVLVLQVPNPEPLRGVEPNISIARQMHADADYGKLWLTLYEQIVRKGRIMQGAAYPSLVNGRHVMTPSPIPRWDVPKLSMARHRAAFRGRPRGRSGAALHPRGTAGLFGPALSRGRSRAARMPPLGHFGLLHERNSARRRRLHL